VFKSSVSSRPSNTGFSLVEIMVGVVIGMISILVVMQVYSVSEGQKRSTTGAGDAQNNGAIALHGLQRDIRQAGHGFSEYSLLGNTLTLPTGSVTILAPVLINPETTMIPAGDAGSDTLLVMYGNGNGQPQGYTDITSSAFAVGDFVVIKQGNLGYGTAAAADEFVVVNTASRLERVTAVTASTITADFTGTVTPVFLPFSPDPSLYVYNFGPAPKLQGYAIRDGNLTMCDFLTNDCSTVNNWVTIANNIVSLRAQYGADAATASVVSVPEPSPNYVVSTYNQTIPATTPPGCGWVRRPAVRLALVARSQQYEKEIVTQTAPVWDGSTAETTNTPTNPGALPIDLSANADWQHYRYKVFQTIVPLRNITWMGLRIFCAP
jgi:type IV pilus assembly protein PilW